MNRLISSVNNATNDNVSGFQTDIASMLRDKSPMHLITKE